MNKWVHRIVVVFGFPVIGFLVLLAVTLMVLGEILESKKQRPPIIVAGHSTCYVALQKQKEKVDKDA